jgi:hypothetical protein
MWKVFTRPTCASDFLLKKHLKPKNLVLSLKFAKNEFLTFKISRFLEYIFKKWALLKSLCRPSVRPSVCLLFLSRYGRIVRSGILGSWPRSPGIWPWPGPLPKKIWALSPWSPAPVAYSLIRPKSHFSNIWHDGTLSFRNFIMMVKNFKNHSFEPLCYIGLRP